MNEVNRNLLIRIASALVLAPPLVVAVLAKDPLAFAIVVQLAVPIASFEFYGIVLAGQSALLRGTFALYALGLSHLFYRGRIDLLIIALLAAPVVASVVQLFRKIEFERAVDAATKLVFGLLYVAVLLTPLALLKKLPDGHAWVILVFTITFFCDTGAYAAGRMLGRHKLAPRISPNKTVEGAIGGMVAACGAAALAHFWYMPQLGWLDGLLIAVFGSVLGQLGDLVESMLKRAYGIKDSGKIIPGHGGLLDRIDALLFVAPYVFLYATYFYPLAR
ncbi:MAG: phosphatidate cytidylyltransferase [Deltaproteobacteria bacterium]|nr:phosphatidate cytidylyltransferase [Deltaproteobacteria bacterium]